MTNSRSQVRTYVMALPSLPHCILSLAVQFR
jgi:hypothetical protein